MNADLRTLLSKDEQDEFELKRGRRWWASCACAIHIADGHWGLAGFGVTCPDSGDERTGE